MIRRLFLISWLLGKCIDVNERGDRTIWEDLGKIDVFLR